MKKRSKHVSTKKKKQRKKLNLEKIFLFVLVLVLAIFLISKGVNSNKEEKVEASANVEEKVEEIIPDTTIKLTAIGDVMSHSTNFKAAYNSSTKIYDFSSTFSQISSYIENNDISIANLETTFAGESRGYSGYPTFNTPAALGKNLKDLGIDVLSTANNHSLDKGYSGLSSTLDELDALGLSHMGTYRSQEDQNTILTKDVNGIKFAFLSFTYGTNGIPVPSGKEYCINLIEKDFMKKQIELAQEQNPDIICVNMHWGIEYQTKENTEQDDLADFLFKNDVDIILGSHPHVLEPMEKRTVTLDDGTTKDGFVIYSLGNFMSGQVIANTRHSIILNLNITKHSDKTITIDSYNYNPIYMNDKDTSSNRYKIMDVQKQIDDYDAGNGKVSAAMYKTLKESLSFTQKIMESNV